jgi:hypothetical protein
MYFVTFSPCMYVENGSAVHPVSCAVGTDHYFPRGEVGGALPSCRATGCVWNFSWAPYVFMT